MAILVTGGAGFIGSHTVVELINGGREVIVADNFCNSSPSVLDNIGKICGVVPKLYEVDIRDCAGLEKIFTENKIEAVIHFAGLKAVGESVKIPLEYYNNNLIGTIVLCQTMAKYGCKKIVFSSSATVYGSNNSVPFIEGYPTSAASPYGYTKVMIEQMLTDLYTADNEWSVSLLRYFNPIGAHKSGLIGEEPSGIPNNLMPYIAQVAVGKLPQLNVFGNDYDTVDGTGIRDYIHVTDLADGHIAALDYVLKNRGVEAVNLGTGKGTSVLELVKAFEKASGREIPYVIKSRRQGDIPECYAGTEKAKSLLNWSASLSIDDMCRDTWNFMVKRYGIS